MNESLSTLNGYAAIGKVCARWSDIESFLQMLCNALARFNSHYFENKSADFVLSIAVLHLDVRGRVALAKVLLNGADGMIETGAEIEALLNKIDNDLRLERNRFVHDEWVISPESASRTYIKPKIINTQSRTRELSMATVKNFESIDELEQFAKLLDEIVRQIVAHIRAIDAVWESKEQKIKHLQQAGWGP